MSVLNKVVRVAGIAGLVVLGACERGVDGPTAAGGPAPDGTVVPQVFATDADAEAIAVARDFPGFAGLYIQDGILIVRMSRPFAEGVSGATIAQRALGATMAARLLARNGAVQVRPATHDFPTLWSVKRAMERVGDETAQLVAVDIDEVDNRVRVTLRDTSASGNVVARARTLGVDVSALVLEVGTVELTQATLNSRVRPLRGGLASTRTFTTGPEAGDGCSIGVMTRYGQQEGFLTASHCTEVIGSFGVPTQFHQFRPTDGLLAQEAWDPAGTSFDCISGWVCRYSDVAFVQRRVDAQDWLADLGHIVRTDFASGGTYAASLFIDPLYPRFEVIGRVPTIAVGMSIDKIGRRTGWTYGQVTQTCTTIWYHAEQLKLFCQHKSLAYVDGGDSGGVFFVSSHCTDPLEFTRPDGTACVEFAGIVSGKDGANRSIFSPHPGMVTDFGLVWPVARSEF